MGWRKLTMLAIAGTLLFIVTLFLFFEATSQPGFCNSCHIMKPYIVAWKNSSHRDVDCMVCHARAGLNGYIETKFTAVSMLANYVTGLYKRSRPWAEIEDVNCLKQGCHETRLLEGKIKFVKGITFDHKPHLTETRRGRQLRCTSCHSQIVQGEHISVTTTTCFLCHFKNVFEENRAELAACQGCHEPPTGDDVTKSGGYDHSPVLEKGINCTACHQKMWEGDGRVDKERCGSCHSSTAHIEKINDLEFIHDWHIQKRKVDCQRCHDPITHQKPVLNQTLANSCAECHQDQHEAAAAVFSGTNSQLLDGAIPDTMFSAGLICMSCHDPTGMGHGTSAGISATCTPCHKESYRRLSTEWKKGFGNRIAQAEKEIQRSGAHPQLESARQDLALLKRGGAWHNPAFANAVLGKISEVTSQAGAWVKLPAKIPSESKPCLTCHSAIAEIPVRLTLSDFSHRAHLADRQLACNQCHVVTDPENPRHGRLTGSSKVCDNCHHVNREMPESCEPCHVPSQMLYSGELPGSPPSPSPMAESGMSCTDCHISPGYKAPDSKFCLDCHDQDVIDDLEFKRGELLIALKQKNKISSETIQTVVLDRGRAVHNPNLAQKVLSGNTKKE